MDLQAQVYFLMINIYDSFSLRWCIFQSNFIFCDAFGLRRTFSSSMSDLATSSGGSPACQACKPLPHPLFPRLLLISQPLQRCCCCEVCWSEAEMRFYVSVWDVFFLPRLHILS